MGSNPTLSATFKSITYRDPPSPAGDSGQCVVARALPKLRQSPCSERREGVGCQIADAIVQFLKRVLEARPVQGPVPSCRLVQHGVDLCAACEPGPPAH